MAARAADQRLQYRRLQRLLEEPVGAHFVHRFYGCFDAAVGSEDYGGGSVAIIAKAFEQSEAVQLPHLQICYNDIYRRLRQFGEGFVAVSRRLRDHAPSRNHGRETTSLAGFVIDN